MRGGNEHKGSAHSPAPHAQQMEVMRSCEWSAAPRPAPHCPCIPATIPTESWCPPVKAPVLHAHGPSPSTPCHLPPSLPHCPSPGTLCYTLLSSSHCLRPGTILSPPHCPSPGILCHPQPFCFFRVGSGPALNGPQRWVLCESRFTNLKPRAH